MPKTRVNAIGIDRRSDRPVMKQVQCTLAAHDKMLLEQEALRQGVSMNKLVASKLEPLLKTLRKKK